MGTAVSLQIHASDSASGQTLTYGATGLPAGLSISSSTGLITGTPTTAGTSSVAVTVINPNGAGETSHSGNWYAWLDGYGTTHTDTLSQSVTIPAACTHTTFSFWLHIDTAETTTTQQLDKLTITANSTTLATFSNLNHANGYTQHTYSLSGFAGATVTLKFTGTEDASLQTSFVVDDTAVTTG